VAEKAQEPKDGKKQEQGHGGKRRHDRGRGRKEHSAPQKEPAAVKEPAKEPAKEPVKGNVDKNRRRGNEQEKSAPRKERVVLERPVPATPVEETFTDEQLRADGLLFTLDEEPVPSAVEPVEKAPAEPEEKLEVIGIRFRGTGKTYYFSPAGITFEEGDHAIVETVRGMEYGDVLQGNRWVGANEVVQPLKPVLRKATEADTRHHLENRRLEDAAKPVFLEKVAGNKLDMQLVDVEYTFDNTKLCFYFTAEGRVDFRELVKDLASIFRTRIELRQIGVRDEASLFGGLGVCGRPFCCKSFLADFVQVSIKMAKEQNLSLASAKISGSCGRLMCCLRYEQDTYERENAAMPKNGSTVDTPKGKAVVLESNFLTKKIKVQTEEDNTIRFFAPEEVVFVAPPTRKSQKEQSEEAEAASLPAD
jgi:cell fate regulator YaaT (PSP1 superfamily)